MSSFKKYILFATVLLSIQLATSQEVSQHKLDSLDVVLFSLDKKDTTRIAELGNYILENTSSDQQKYKIFQKLSESYFRTNNIDKSIAFLFKTKEIAEKVGDPVLLAQAYGSIANQYSYLNLNEKAHLYLNQAIEQIDKLPEGNNKHRLKAMSSLELGNLDFNDDNFLEANKNYRKSLEEFNQIEKLDKNNIYNYRRSLYNIGNTYYYLKAPDSAETYLKRALSVKDPQSPNLKYYIYSTLAEVYTFRGNNKQSIDTLNAIINDSNFNIPSLKSEIYLNLSKNYKALGDDSHYALYNEKHLALLEEQRGEDRKAISTAFNVEQKDFIASISQSRKRNQWLVICIIIIVLLSVGSIVYLNKRKKKERTIYKSIINRLENEAGSTPKSDVINDIETDSGHRISSSVEREILDKLMKFEDSEKFRNPKLTITTLAVQLKTNPTYLSTVIKTHANKNFNTYINELRIGYICEKIHLHPEYLNYKISYLAEDCGFASHSTFSTIFKSVTGISPSVFLREEGKSYLVKAKH